MKEENQFNAHNLELYANVETDSKFANVLPFEDFNFILEITISNGFKRRATQSHFNSLVNFKRN